MERIEAGEIQATSENDMVMGPVMVEDVYKAMSTTRPSAQKDLSKYLQWQDEFGSV